MTYCLYRNGEWIALWANEPTVDATNNVVKNRELAKAILLKRTVIYNGVEYKLIKRKLIGR